MKLKYTFNIRHTLSCTLRFVPLLFLWMNTFVHTHTVTHTFTTPTPQTQTKCRPSQKLQLPVASKPCLGFRFPFCTVPILHNIYFFPLCMLVTLERFYRIKNRQHSYKSCVCMISPYLLFKASISLACS